MPVGGQIRFAAAGLLLGLLVSGAGCAARPPLAPPPARATDAAPKQDGAPRARTAYRRLSDRAPTDCALAPWVAAVDDGCARVTPLSVTSSTGLDPGLLADGSLCTVWNSGGYAPHELVLELPPGTRVSALLLATEQTPAGVTTQIVEVSDDGEAWRELAALHGHTETERVYAAAPRPAPSARFVRVRTVESPSWVAFREVAVLSCPSRVRLSGAAVPRRSPVDHSGERWARGEGACERASACAPDDCCAPTTCVARDAAPRCRGVGCPRVHTGITTTCACRRGACGAWIRDERLGPGIGLDPRHGGSGD